MRIRHYCAFALLLLHACTLPAQNWGLFGDSEYDIYSFFHDTTDNSLYIGGIFQWFEEMDAKGIVRWDGQSFQQLGDFPNSFCNNYNCDPVRSITRYKDEIYCTLYNGPWQPGQIRGLARWDGISWDSIAGIVGGVLEQVIYDGDLYIMGTFEMAEDPTAFAIIRWDGEQWHRTGFTDWLGYQEKTSYVGIYAATVFNGELYVGGNFWTADGTPVDVARFDGTDWHVVGGGIEGGADDVASMAVYRGELYISGDFHKSGLNGGNMVARLKDGHWEAVGGSFDWPSGVAHKLLVWHDRLYVFGTFLSSVGGGLPARNAAVWDGEQWCNLGSDFENGIVGAVVYNDTLIIGGGFDSIDNVPYHCMAKWLGGDSVGDCILPASASGEATARPQATISPNPAAGQFEADLPAGLAASAELRLFAATGQRVLTQQVLAGRNTVVLEGIVPGIYFYEVRNKGQLLESGKLVKGN